MGGVISRQRPVGEMGIDLLPHHIGNRATGRRALGISNTGEEEVLGGHCDGVLTTHAPEGEALIPFAPDLIAIATIAAQAVIDLLGGRCLYIGRRQELRCSPLATIQAGEGHLGHIA